jgi:hypothetical protein
MDTEKVTTPANAPARTRTSSGMPSHLTIDRGESGRPSIDTDQAPPTFRRLTESHWEWIIDRATD